MVTTRSSKRQRLMFNPQSRSVLVIAPNDIQELIFEFLSLNDCHSTVPILCQYFRDQIYKRPMIAYIVDNKNKSNIPSKWREKLYSLRITQTLPTFSSRLPNLELLVLKNLVIEDWVDDIANKGWLTTIKSLIILNCKITGLVKLELPELCELVIRRSTVHDKFPWREETGQLSMDSLPMLQRFELQGGCQCCHVEIGDLFENCMQIKKVKAPLRFDVFLNPAHHLVENLTELCFVAGSHNLIQVQANALPKVAPGLRHLVHPDCRANDMMFTKLFRQPLDVLDLKRI